MQALPSVHRRWTPPVRTALALAVVSALAACGDTAKLPETAGMGPNPTLPAPITSLIPTVKIAPAKGWPAGRSDADGNAGPDGDRLCHRAPTPALGLHLAQWRCAGG